MTPEHRKRISEAHKASGLKPPIHFGEKSSNWKGGRIIRSGYIYIKFSSHPRGSKQGYVAEHRLVMEKHLGRLLERSEVVHHRDQNKMNNTIENLELCSSAGQHTKLFHPEVAKRNSILNRGIRRSPRTEFKKGQVPWNKKQSLHITF